MHLQQEAKGAFCRVVGSDHAAQGSAAWTVTRNRSRLRDRGLQHVPGKTTCCRGTDARLCRVAASAMTARAVFAANSDQTSFYHSFGALQPLSRAIGLATHARSR